MVYLCKPSLDRSVALARIAVIAAAESCMSFHEAEVLMEAWFFRTARFMACRREAFAVAAACSMCYLH